MPSLWNVLSAVRTGIVSIAGSGNELFGTVTKHGINNKTVTVRVSARHWIKKYKRYLYGHANKLVHDELNYCVTGDKVLIKTCKKMSVMKAYYVKSIIRPMGRDEVDRSKSQIHTYRRYEFNIAEHPFVEPNVEAVQGPEVKKRTRAEPKKKVLTPEQLRKVKPPKKLSQAKYIAKGKRARRRVKK